MTEAEIEKKAKEEYEALIGSIIEITEGHGFLADDSIDLTFNPPLKVKVGRADDNSVFRWIDDWYDPDYPVEALEERPELKGVSLWIYGTSYQEKTGKTEPARFKMLSPASPYPNEPLS
jgi:hypothetical protein